MIIRRQHAGFTLVELMVGLALALMVLAAVTSSYLFMGRNLSRLVNQQTLETQSRLMLQHFLQDVRMASSVTSPSATGFTLTVPTSTGTTTVVYAYDSSAKTLTRTPASGNARVLLQNLQSLSFTFYDAGTTVTNYVDSVAIASIRQVSYAFTAQIGSSANGTLTPLFQGASPKVLMHNKTWSP